jgi:hypothetical protein
MQAARVIMTSDRDLETMYEQVPEKIKTYVSDKLTFAEEPEKKLCSLAMNFVMLARCSFKKSYTLCESTEGAYQNILYAENLINNPDEMLETQF